MSDLCPVLNICGDKLFLSLGRTKYASLATIPELVGAAAGELEVEESSWTESGGRTVASGNGWRVTRTVETEAEGVWVEVGLVCPADSPLVHVYDHICSFLAPVTYLWTPWLCPDPCDVIGDHALRSPLILIQSGGRMLAVAPDVDCLRDQRFPARQLNAESKDVVAVNRDKPQLPLVVCLEKQPEKGAHAVSVGLADYVWRGHWQHTLTGKAVRFPAGTTLRYAYRIFAWDNVKPCDPRRAVAFVWKHYAVPYLEDIKPQVRPFPEYHAISLREAEVSEYVESPLPDGSIGAGFNRHKCRINSDGTTLDPYMGLPYDSTWFFGWFNSLRTAFGACHAARRADSLVPDWEEKALRIKALALSAPHAAEGLLPAVHDSKTGEWWAGVPRLGPGRDCYDTSGMAHTALWMWRWYRHLDPDPNLAGTTTAVCERLMCLQNGDGSFPSYIDGEGRATGPLRHAAQSGMAAWLLGEWGRDTGCDAALDSLGRACRFFTGAIVPEGRYHDFEAFFSCSDKPLDFYDHRIGQHVQNNLCLYWMTEALFTYAEAGGGTDTLTWACRLLDQLSLYQQVWDPPFLSFYGFGGFGVMNTDGEWNDMRQVFFSLLYAKAYRMTGRKECFERAVAALRAGCALICHPAHRDINPLCYNKRPDGVSPESFAHGGVDGLTHVSGFDWGSGSLIAACAWMERHFGDIYVNVGYGHAFGIDGVLVAAADFSNSGLTLSVMEQTGTARQVTVVVDYGQSRGTVRIVISLEAGKMKSLSLALEHPELKACHQSKS